ncbi:alpha/beta fold hydrolase [Hydrogenophaga sp.]|uniref:alpha/beta fold hydrolase n=1 Tax=Hydrogenophaga sp. TaxID=1904254 RepID=UPI00356153B1
MPERKSLRVDGPAARGGGDRHLSYWEWTNQAGNDDPHVVICVHGLSRQGRDFDVLAQALSRHARVLAVDVAGRGESDWLADAMAYQLGTYVADMGALVAQVRQESPSAVLDWVGTSMGGMIGMAMAAQPAVGLRRLVLNDVGPTIQWAALQRIAAYLGQNPGFSSEAEAFDYLASISQGFGPHTAEQWRALSQPMLRQRDGRWWLHYDPAIALPVKALVQASDQTAAQQMVRDGEAAMWGVYEAITARTLLLRGADSDLLTRETAARMAQCGPQARCVEFAGVGHAPTLVAPDQVEAVCEFLWAD